MTLAPKLPEIKYRESSISKKIVTVAFAKGIDPSLKKDVY